MDTKYGMGSSWMFTKRRRHVLELSAMPVRARRGIIGAGDRRGTDTFCTYRESRNNTATSMQIIVQPAIARHEFIF